MVIIGGRMKTKQEIKERIERLKERQASFKPHEIWAETVVNQLESKIQALKWVLEEGEC
jgi:hypothetical protein